MDAAGFVAPFAALGGELDRAFRRAEYDEAAFPDLAVEHVQRARLHERFDLDALARWVLSARELPPQHDLAGQFGEPPITLWWGRRFFVSALVWRDSTTTVHDHAFTGAFQVLQGSSLHARYTFEPTRRISDDVLLGDLRCQSAETLAPGAVRPITRELLHSLFHLHHPSVSLVVRTPTGQGSPIQYDYREPGLATFSQRDDARHKRARQFARMLARLGSSSAATIIGEALREGATAHDTIAVLDEVHRGGDLELALDVLDAVRPKLDGVLARAIEEGLRAHERDRDLTRCRRSVRDATLRHLLAVLLNAPTRRHAVAFAEAHAPDRPGGESLAAWIADLARLPRGPLELPAPDEASLATLRSALAGEPVASATALPFFDAVRRHRAFARLFRD